MVINVFNGSYIRYLFYSSYIFISLLIIFSWLILPNLVLLFFLIVAAYHFGKEDTIFKLKKNLSFGEKKMLEQCRQLLAQEIAISNGDDMKIVEDKLNNCFN